MSDKHWTEREGFIRKETYDSYFPKLVINFDGEFDEPMYFRKLISEIKNTDEKTVIEFVLNTPGGRTDTLVSILDALDTTKAKKVSHIHDASSCGSILALACDEVNVAKFGEMFIHSFQWGSGYGPVANHENRFKSSVENMKLIFNEYYKGFLSDSEIQDVINGKEFWLNASEIKKRLKNRKK